MTDPLSAEFLRYFERDVREAALVGEERGFGPMTFTLAIFCDVVETDWGLPGRADEGLLRDYLFRLPFVRVLRDGKRYQYVPARAKGLDEGRR